MEKPPVGGLGNNYTFTLDVFNGLTQVCITFAKRCAYRMFLLITMYAINKINTQMQYSSYIRQIIQSIFSVLCKL